MVCAAIHTSGTTSFPYAALWEERAVHPRDKLTHTEGNAFLALAADVPLKVEMRTYPLVETNRALEDLRLGGLEGAAGFVP